MVQLGARTLLFLTATVCRRAAAFQAPLSRLPVHSAVSLSPALSLRKASLPLGRALYMSAAVEGDLVAVNWAVKTADGKALPEEAQVFDQGKVRLVVGAGGDLLSCCMPHTWKMHASLMSDTNPYNT
jgi:hypothetical protein